MRATNPKISTEGWHTARIALMFEGGAFGYPDARPWIVSAGAEIGAEGLVGRKVVGKGVAIFRQVDPDSFDADEKTYFRYTPSRSTRAVAQLLANLGPVSPATTAYSIPSILRGPIRMANES